MKEVIAVGIDSGSTYAAQICYQMGVSSAVVENMIAALKVGIRVFFSNDILNNVLDVSSEERVAVITHHGALGSRSPEQENLKSRSYYFSLNEKCPYSSHHFYANLPVFHIKTESFGCCYDRDNKKIPNSGIGIIQMDNLLIVSLPWDICSYEQGHKWEHRPYFSQSEKRHFVEVGPMLDTSAFRTLMLEILLHCFNWVGLPLVRVSPFYNNKRYFSFRIDADGFSESSTKAGLRIAEKSGLQFSWFLDMGRWKNKNEWVVRLLKAKQDIQLHCFRHMTYASHEVNYINIRKGLNEMRKCGITPSAIVSPMGFNYRGFSEAIRRLRFAYSSEFGYAVDDLPSQPFNDKFYPLQIPVHPGCSGVFLQAGFSQQEQFNHYYNTVKNRCDTDGFCIFYDHPIGGLETYEEQYIDLFAQLKKNSYKYISMLDYYRAWICRSHNPTIIYSNGIIEIQGFQENGFRLEQIVNGLCDSVRLGDEVLPQVNFQGGGDHFCYPPEWVRNLTYQNGMLNLKQRNFIKIQWYMNEFLLTFGTRIGYFKCRRLLSRVAWLRTLRDRILNAI